MRIRRTVEWLKVIASSRVTNRVAHLGTGLIIDYERKEPPEVRSASVYKGRPWKGIKVLTLLPRALKDQPKVKHAEVQLSFISVFHGQ